MKIQCDVCERAPATVICCADEAALCDECDIQVHAANKLASKHRRLLLQSSTKLPLCDICQEKPAFIFCVEDRALFCRDCDEPIHVAGSLSGDHRRLLATGISVALGSVTRTKDAAKAKKSSTKPSDITAVPSKSEVPMAQLIPSPFTTSAWSVDEFLQLSDYESGDKRGSPIGFGELDWFADIGLFPDQQVSNESLAAAEVPQLRYSSASKPPTITRPAKSGNAVKKPRIAISDDDEFFTVPDLGY